MAPKNMVAVLLIACGALALAYGGFSYTKETHQADVGALHLSVDETKRVNIPLWAGVGAMVVGGFLLLNRGKN